MKKTIVLCILDGWGLGKKDESNPIYNSDLKAINYIKKNYKGGSLKSSGFAVGLPWETAGNSEVGHLTIGSGRVLYQHFLRINDAIDSGIFFENKALKEAYNHVNKNNSSLHLIGLLTEGAVHSHIDHLKALIKMADDNKISNLYLHLFTDGRDSDPHSAKKLLEEINQTMNEKGVGEIISIAGRYYGMDRDNNWNLVEQTYNMLMGNAPKKEINKAIKETYYENLSDEYIKPFIVRKQPIKNNDAIIFFNFREDRMRELAHVFVDSDFNKFKTQKIKNLYVASMTQYENNLNNPTAFDSPKIKNVLGEVLAKNNKTQMRISETQKYAHVTYFFNGLHEEPFENEFRVLIPSDKIEHYDQKPEMKAEEITNRVILSLQNNEFDFILMNYPNPDIIGHTGNYQAVKKAVKFVDEKIKILAQTSLSNDHTLIITSDHGNAECLLDLKTGQPRTEHEANPVPFLIVDKKYKKETPSNGELQKIGILPDIAPTILDLMNIPKPEEMTGKSLLALIN
jgi:2,3-bisphosphoglycerate-independent phosphoglycerate mutase